MAKKKRVWLIVLIVIVSLFLVLGIGVTCIYQFSIKPKIIEQLNSTPEKDTELSKAVGVLMEEVEQILKDEEMQKFINEEEPDKARELLEMIESVKKEKEEGTKPPKTAEEKYDDIINNIDSEDMKIGKNFASRVDVGYLLGLLNDGLTREERREMKNYLRTRFSSTEISKGIELFGKYSYLLS